MPKDELPPEPRSLDEAIVDDVRAQRRESLEGPDRIEGSNLGEHVGANVARYRARRAFSLAELAERSGIDADLLARLESGAMSPSMRAIWRLATALDLTFGALLTDERAVEGADADFRVQRADDGQVIASSNDRFRSRVLFREGDPRMPEVYELTLAPGCGESAEAHAPDTYEHLAVIAGTLIVRAGDPGPANEEKDGDKDDEKEVRLEPGDVLFFRADVPHRYENPGDQPTVVHLIMQFGPARPA